MIAAWAKGGKPGIPFPAQAGYHIGGTYARYVIVEVHLDNPNYESGNIIASGFRLYTTTKFRQYDAGSIVLVSLLEGSFFPQANLNNKRVMPKFAFPPSPWAFHALTTSRLVRLTV